MKRQYKLKKCLFKRKHFLAQILLFILLTISILAITNLSSKKISSAGAVNNPACYGLNISKAAVAVNQAVNISASVSGYGIIRMAKVGAVGKRVVEGEGAATITRGTGTLRAIFSSQSPGIYVFEINAYDNNRCNFFCSAGKILYKNTNFYGGGCETAGHWQTFGNCTSNSCIKWLTVTDSLTATTCIPQSHQPTCGGLPVTLTSLRCISATSKVFVGECSPPVAGASLQQVRYCKCQYSVKHYYCDNQHFWVYAPERSYVQVDSVNQCNPKSYEKNYTCTASDAACDVCCRNGWSPVIIP